MKQVKKPNAVYKMGKRTAKSDMHSNNRNSVFQKSLQNMDPLSILMASEHQPARKSSANKGK